MSHSLAGRGYRVRVRFALDVGADGRAGLRGNDDAEAPPVAGDAPALAPGGAGLGVGGFTVVGDAFDEAQGPEPDQAESHLLRVGGAAMLQGVVAEVLRESAVEPDEVAQDQLLERWSGIRSLPMRSLTALISRTAVF